VVNILKKKKTCYYDADIYTHTSVLCKKHVIMMLIYIHTHTHTHKHTRLFYANVYRNRRIISAFPYAWLPGS